MTEEKREYAACLEQIIRETEKLNKIFDSFERTIAACAECRTPEEIDDIIARGREEIENIE